MNKSVFEDMNVILKYAHFWNWAPDWNVVKDIYSCIPESYSALTPFAYSYLEELIRSSTSEYGIPFLDRSRKKYNFKVGMELIKLAKEGNAEKPEYIALLDKAKKYFQYIYKGPIDKIGRNKVVHGHLHPCFWSQEVFEQLIHDIAELAPFAKA